MAFRSKATTLVAGDTNGAADIFVRDRETSTTVRVSLATDGTQGNNNSGSPSISDDGRHVAFGSLATTLVAGDTNGFRDVFVHDYLGDTTPPTTTDDVASPYIGEALISLVATDTGGSGVAATYYRLNGGAVATYTAPITVSGGGSYTLQYWSVDHAGNIEVAHSVPFVIYTEIVRRGGRDRYAVAVDASRANFDSSDEVILATGWTYADALSASGLAGCLEAPILVTLQDRLPANVEAEIVRLEGEQGHHRGRSLLGGPLDRDASARRPGAHRRAHRREATATSSRQRSPSESVPSVTTMGVPSSQAARSGQTRCH